MIDAFKRLRKSVEISEELVCNKCKLNCPRRNAEVKSSGRVYELLLFFHCLWKKEEKHYSILRWCAAFRILESLKVVLKDIEQLEQENALYTVATEGEMRQKRKKNFKKEA